MIKPEELKLVAEVMGLHSWIADEYCEPVTWIETGDPSGFVERRKFNPYTNAEQREEILLWLVGKGWELYIYGKQYVFLSAEIVDNEAKRIQDKDYTEALLNAALQQVNEL